MYIEKKGGFTMTDVLSIYDMEPIVENVKDIQLKEKVNEKAKKITIFIAIKKSKELDRLVKEYIVKNKKIRDGKAVIKGTRITPVELMYCVDEILKENKNEKTFEEIRDYLYEQYPSINNENQIKAAVSYIIKKEISTIKYIVNILKND